MHSLFSGFHVDRKPESISGQTPGRSQQQGQRSQISLQFYESPLTNDSVQDIALDIDHTCHNLHNNSNNLNMHGKPLDYRFFRFFNGIVSRERLVVSGRIEHGGGEGDTTQWVHRSRKNVISAQSKSFCFIIIHLLLK
jgi:hypothetical protein